MDIYDIPKKSVVAIYGPPHSGKMPLMLSKLGLIHHDDPEAIVVVFDTEHRHSLLDEVSVKQFGLDPSRLVVFGGNHGPAIESALRDIKRFMDEGAPIKAVAIYSISSINYPADPSAPIGQATLLMYAMAQFARQHKIDLLMVAHVRQVFGLRAVKYRPSPGGIRTVCDYLIRSDGDTGVEVEEMERDR